MEGRKLRRRDNKIRRTDLSANKQVVDVVKEGEESEKWQEEKNLNGEKKQENRKKDEHMKGRK